MLKKRNFSEKFSFVFMIKFLKKILAINSKNMEGKMYPTKEFVMYLLSFLPSRLDYNSWVLLVSAIANAFDEKTALAIILSKYPDEKPNETIQKINSRLRNVSFGFLVNLAKEHGYKQEKTTSINRFYGAFRREGISKYPLNKIPVSFDGDPELLFRFKDESLEEKARLYEFEKNISRSEADARVISENPTCQRERLYRIAVNNKILNKNLNPVTGNPFENYKTLTTGFKNNFLSLYELAVTIGSGSAIICCNLKEDVNGNTYKKTENFNGSDCLAIDIDDGMTIEEAFSKPETAKSILIYTTVSHTENNHRFRIIFPLPRFIRNRELFTRTVTKFIDIYKADRNCKDPCRSFYGNNFATIFLVSTNQVLKFEKGKLC
jgi:hypothetical protein